MECVLSDGMAIFSGNGVNAAVAAGLFNRRPREQNLLFRVRMKKTNRMTPRQI